MTKNVSTRYSYKPTLRWNPDVEAYLSNAYGVRHFSRISHALTLPSSYSCIRVNTLRSSPEAVLPKLISILRPSDDGSRPCQNQNFENGSLDNHGLLFKHRIHGFHDVPFDGGFSKIEALGDDSVFLKRHTPNSDDTVFASESATIQSSETETLEDEIIFSKCKIVGFNDPVFTRRSISNHNSEMETLGDESVVPNRQMPDLHDAVFSNGSTCTQISQTKPLDDHSTVFMSGFAGLHDVVFVRGSGPHTIDYEDPVKEVIVSRKCAEAVLRGAEIFVPGVLACTSHIQRGDKVAVSVAVEQPCVGGGWGVGITRGTVMQGCEGDPFFVERSGLYIGQGIAMMSRAGIFRSPGGVAVEMRKRAFDLKSFHGVLEGDIFLQNLPSIVAAHVVGAQRGDRVLDMCAAPGGKTTAVAAIMEDEGEIIAVDRSHNKVLEIQHLADEMGSHCITAIKLDALRAVQSIEEVEPLVKQSSMAIPGGLVETCSNYALNGSSKVDNIKGVNRGKLKQGKKKNGPGRNQGVSCRAENSTGFSPNSFDRVLLDAPCSALGLRPRLFVAVETLTSLRNHAKYQRRLLDQAVQLVHPGGVMVYSTCTINPGENEAVVRYALDTYKFLTLAPQHPRIGGPGLVGSFCFDDGYVEEWLRPGEETLVQRFDPSSSMDTIGFFIAKFSVGLKS